MEPSQPMQSINVNKGNIWKILSIVFAVLFVISIASTVIFVIQNHDKNKKIDDLQSQLGKIKKELESIKNDSDIETTPPVEEGESDEDLQTAKINLLNAGFTCQRFTVGSIQDSVIKPYQTLEVGVGLLTNDNVSGCENGIGSGWYELYYRVSPNDTWKLFMDGQGNIGCDSYDTDDLRNAFAGKPCLDTMTNSDSTVKPAN